MQQLRNILHNIDGKGYKAYKQIKGSYRFQNFILHIDFVQGDPFASPSKIRLEIPKGRTVLKSEWESTPVRKIRVEDTLARVVAKAIEEMEKRAGGSGKSGIISVDLPGQTVLQRTAVQLGKDAIFICLSLGLPARGRTVLGKQAERMLLTGIPQLLNRSIFSLKVETVRDAIILCDQQAIVREYMKKERLIAFVANGSILPRENGISDQPLEDDNVVPFYSPDSLIVSISVPHRSTPIKGMGIREGITLFVGGGYHGKSTILEAIERGVYEHIEGDGREFVLTEKQAMKVRAEDGRQVTNVNISPFVQNLPFGKATTRFTSEDASGSTSQAATIIESLEADAKVLLIDEDTSATNFMIRDHRMQQLVSKSKEPITPFIDKVNLLYEDYSVSTMLVMGGSGDYFDVADTIILLDQYVPYDVTSKAKDIAAKATIARQREGGFQFGTVSHRIPNATSLDSRKGKKAKVTTRGLHTIQFGKSYIQLNFLAQLVDSSQTRAIAEILHFLEKKKWLGTKTLVEILQRVENQLDERGLSSFTDFPNQHPGDLARPRMLELASALNRLRTLKIKI